MSLAAILAILTLVIALPLNLYVTVRLWQLSLRAPRIRVLRERAVVATSLTIIVAVFAAIFWNNDTVPPYLGSDVTKWVTRAAVLVMSVLPTVYWLRLYRHGRTTTDADDSDASHPRREHPDV